jgi:anti-sigma B factor antagonist
VISRRACYPARGVAETNVTCATGWSASGYCAVPMTAGAPFDLSVDADGSAATISVRGDLDLASAPELSAACKKAIEQSPETLRIDLGDLTFLDSSGISVLVQAQRDLETQGGVLVLHRVGDRTRRVLEVAGLSEFFTQSDQPTG